MLKEGNTAPNFSLPTDEGQVVNLKDLRGKKVVLYFYPKDDTPGCTVEACNFRDGFPKFESKNAVIFGVSRDSVESHQKFRNKFHLNFPLLADTEGKVCEDYGVWVEKNNYGKKYMGIQRSTFIIDENGKIMKVFPKVSVEGHADEVLGIVSGQTLGMKAASTKKPAKKAAKKPAKKLAKKKTAKKTKKVAKKKPKKKAKKK